MSTVGARTLATRLETTARRMASGGSWRRQLAEHAEVAGDLGYPETRRRLHTVLAERVGTGDPSARAAKVRAVAEDLQRLADYGTDR